MRKIFPKPLYYFLAILIAIVSLIGVTILFIMSSSLADSLAKGLNLKITPAYIGGNTATEFFDALFDDNGSGVLEYPSNKVFTDGSLDLVRYVVHEPVYEAHWQSLPEYWQFNLEYRSGPGDVRNIMIYIDADGDGKGETSTLFDNAENVTFSAEHPWDYAISVHEKTGAIYGSNKQVIDQVQLSIPGEGKEVIIRIPLVNKELQKLYTVGQTYHYVLTGAFSKWDRGFFMPIEKNSTVSRGGTENRRDWSSLIPRLYDILDDPSAGAKGTSSVSATLSQTAQLSSWNGDTMQKAILYPVEINMRSENSSLMVSEETLSESRKLYKAASEISAKKSLTSFETADKSDKKSYGIAAFSCGKIDEATQAFDEYLATNPVDAESIAYKGSLIAMKANGASAIQAVALVNEAYSYLDKAVELAEKAYASESESTGANESADKTLATALFTALMNRASVSSSVPESVFGKALTGATDFMRCVELLDKIDIGQSSPDDVTIERISLYFQAASCYETANKTSESRIWYKEATRLFNTLEPNQTDASYLSLKIKLLEKSLIN